MVISINFDIIDNFYVKRKETKKLKFKLLTIFYTTYLENFIHHKQYFNSFRSITIHL